MSERCIIVGVKINDRVHHAEDVQKILTEYGCSIKARIGLHETGSICAPDGILLLQMCSEQHVSEELMEKLNALEGIIAKSMMFE